VTAFSLREVAGGGFSRNLPAGAPIPPNPEFRSRGLEPERCGSPFLFDSVKKLASDGGVSWGQSGR
jgi:hypothetical protein